jgi:hypothetical protein
MGKCSNAFFSETTNIIKAKLYMNVHWMVLYKFYVFCSDMKISDRHKKHKICREPSSDHSWAVWFQLSKWFQRRSVLKHFSLKAKLYMNVHWMVLYKLYVFCSVMKFKMAATVGLSLTLDPMRKMFQNASSLKPLGQLKPNCPGMITGRSSTKFVFYNIYLYTMKFVTSIKIRLNRKFESTELKTMTMNWICRQSVKLISDNI